MVPSFNLARRFTGAPASPDHFQTHFWRTRHTLPTPFPHTFHILPTNFPPTSCIHATHFRNTFNTFNALSKHCPTHFLPTSYTPSILILPDILGKSGHCDVTCSSVLAPNNLFQGGAGNGKTVRIPDAVCYMLRYMLHVMLLENGTPTTHHDVM